MTRKETDYDNSLLEDCYENIPDWCIDKISILSQAEIESILHGRNDNNNDNNNNSNINNNNSNININNSSSSLHSECKVKKEEEKEKYTPMQEASEGDNNNNININNSNINNNNNINSESVKTRIAELPMFLQTESLVLRRHEHQFRQEMKELIELSECITLISTKALGPPAEINIIERMQRRIKELERNIRANAVGRVRSAQRMVLAAAIAFNSVINIINNNNNNNNIVRRAKREGSRAEVKR